MLRDEIMSILDDMGIGQGGTREASAKEKTITYVLKIVADQEIDQNILRTMVSSFFDGVMASYCEESLGQGVRPAVLHG